MQLEAALMKERGVTFVVLVVKRHAFNSPDKDDLTEYYSDLFEGVPAVLMAQDSRGIPEYYGRRDIVNFLSDVPFEALPWRKWTFSGV